MSAEALVSRLEGVRARGKDRWIARCPAHADKSPSLTVSELPDGRVLLHCHAQCAVESVLAAVGLEFDALFPPNPIEHAKGERRPISPSQALAIIERETLVVCVAAATLRAGKPLSEADHTRLSEASRRIYEAVRLARG